MNKRDTEELVRRILREEYGARLEILRQKLNLLNEALARIEANLRETA